MIENTGVCAEFGVPEQERLHSFRTQTALNVLSLYIKLCCILVIYTEYQTVISYVSGKKVCRL